MEVITSHINADFDSLASMIAAKKLYPRAKLIFPGACGENVKQFLEQHNLSYQFEKIKYIKLKEIKKLILVDTRLSSRIGKFEEIVKKVVLHIYDHHPFHSEDLEGKINYKKEIGATITLMIEFLRERKIKITPIEATLFLLGIYEDTGCLTFKITTPLDLTISAYLLSLGADLTLVSNFIQRELTSEQIVLLNDLIQAARIYYIRGKKIIITTIKPKKYNQDLSLLTHKLREIEKPNCIFTLIELKNRVNIIARSNTEEINVDQLLQQFNGGGHPYAASASVKETNLEKIIKKITMLLHQKENFNINLEEEKKKNVKSILKGRTTKYIYNLLQEIGRIASELNFNAYIVGGFVRDLFLNIKNLDIDVVIEGDGIKFAEYFAKKHQYNITSHSKFHTAIIGLAKNFKIDVSTARTEFYEYPGALPIVAMNSIKQDLYRRDFSINSLAIKLNADGFGNLYDFFNAREDLKKGIIRILHNFSFVEDPTRIVRAIRFEKRLGFTIEPYTHNLMVEAMKSKMLDQITKERLTQEIKLILAEEKVLSAVERLKEFKILKYLHPKINLTDKLKNMFKHTEILTSWFNLLDSKEMMERWIVFLLVLIDSLDIKETSIFVQKLTFEKKVQRIIEITKNKSEKILQYLKKEKDLSNSLLYSLLKNVPVEVLLYIMSKTESLSVEKKISLYLTQLIEMKLEINGQNLIELGIRKGPEIGKILKKVLLAKLDGKVKNFNEEIAYVKNIMASVTKNSARCLGTY